MGEALISSGDVESGVEHMANAVVVCAQPTQLLQVLQQTLPPQVFTLLIKKVRSNANANLSESESNYSVMNRLSDNLIDDLE